MRVFDHMPFKISHVVSLSQRARVTSLVLISMAMCLITAHFYVADAVYARASVLPVYIFFFILMYMACVIVEYVSLWCKRGEFFHCTRVTVHALALVLVTYEMGAFYGSDRNVYSHPPSYSLTSALSHIVAVPSLPHDQQI